MYTLDNFSKMSGVPIETIHEYEKVALLPPKDSDHDSGKSLYTSAELIILHNLTVFVQMGFTTNELVNFMNNSQPEFNLQEKKEQLERKIARLNRKLTQLDDFLLEAEECNVVIKSVPEVAVAAKDVAISDVMELCQIACDFYKELEEMGCEIQSAEYRYIVFHGEGYEEQDFKVQLCVSVKEVKADTDTIRFLEIPAVPKAACSYHKGLYDSLHLTRTFSALWMDYRGYVIEGDYCEVYIDGIWNKDSENEWLTEVRVPLKA
jgi:DNA-binding transcriptional MerR regulator